MNEAFSSLVAGAVTPVIASQVDSEPALNFSPAAEKLISKRPNKNADRIINSYKKGRPWAPLLQNPA
jgi:hypothetical protein